MKIMICGKGGSGKSTLTVLLARALSAGGKRVLVIDADESNLCLHRLLGARLPEIMMDAMGGRKGTREKLRRATEQQTEEDFFSHFASIDYIPPDWLEEADGIKLLVLGKIKEFGEGCACMIGNIAKTVLSRLQEQKNDVVLIDAEAGLEHFGRQVDRGCDLLLCVIDPSYESIQMAGRARQIAAAAGVETFFILNKVEDGVRELMAEKLDPQRVIAAIPRNDELFVQSLKGEPLAVEMEQIGAACRFISSFRRPLTLNVRL